VSSGVDDGFLVARMLATVTLRNLAELPAWASELLAGQRVAHLGLHDDQGWPRVLPVTFAIAEDRIWSAVDDKPKRTRGEELARVRFLRADPRVALTADHYSDDWTRLAWVQVLGRVRIFSPAEAAAGLAALSAKYEPYCEAAPPGPLLALEPDRCLCWRAADAQSDRT
jgi:PPOX class probable F420-dependent enzyme